MQKRQIVRTFVVLQVAILALLAIATPAFATNERDVASLTKAKTGIQLVKPAAKDKTGEPYEIWYMTNKSVKNPKSSNIKVAGMGLQDWGSVKYLVVVPHKAGTTKLSFTYNGKKYTTTYTVRNWTNPVKKFTIGKTNVTSKFNKAATYTYSTDKRTFVGKKVSVTAASGYKVVRLEVATQKGYKTIKNGATVPKSAMSVIAVLKHTKTGAIANVNIQ
ncbi:MAG: hypothetical protein Q4A07_00860 [Coriobacteriales bacterium]|nr:hypothetical protein [Coriobacteriales bacterium]